MVEGEGRKEGGGKVIREEGNTAQGLGTLPPYPRPTVYVYVGLLRLEVRVKALELSLSLSALHQLLSRVLTKNSGDQPTAWQPHQEHE